MKCANLPIEKYYNYIGKFYGYHIRTSIEASATLNLVMKTSNTSYQHFASPIVITNTEITVDYYKDTEYTGGTNVLSSVWSNNHVALRESTVQELKLNATVSNYGDCFYPEYYPATNQTPGAQVPEIIGWLLDQNTFYSAKIVNLGNAGIVKFSLFWGETNG